MPVGNWKFLLIDRNNEGLLCPVVSQTVGINLLGGILDSRLIELPLHRVMYHKYAHLDFNNEYLRVTPKRVISPLDPMHITEIFLNKRAEALARAKYLELLEMISFLSLAKSHMGYPSNIVPLLNQEIQRCDPNLNQYSIGIREYADINNISPEVAYEEIKFRIQGATLTRIRDFAIFQKYVRIFNTCPLTDLESSYFKLREEVFLNAST
ncbi:MAG: hypothetical protein A2622_05920 [Bdellovibrionales bacterium RIFCSPHIGHO2_01_FULL_40_29]|nr:MAG: hypothetical protein A2622_05920 [Bdellovibrionales bacterium RIFCSPHIGHO2_01_FULL_40_29]OFZ34990.1 MAG: hypothetical protein A3D17_06270 [Bdellovibrionales bacterium RIFCSPHIGHO2_02_FULL_40_15]